jgi:hypothetical protein
MKKIKCFEYDPRKLQSGKGVIMAKNVRLGIKELLTNILRQGSLTEREGSVQLARTSLDQLLFLLKIEFTSFTKQATSMGRQMVLVLILPPQLVFPAQDHRVFITLLLLASRRRPTAT